MRPSRQPTARLTGAGRRFGDVVALEGLTLDVVPGSVLGVIGPSGAGKTTAIRLLSGGLRPSVGSVRVFDEDPTRLRNETRERIGFMPQHVSLALALLGTGIGLVVLAVFVVGFGVPFLAAPAPVLMTLGLLVLASTGLGVVIALVSDSDRQAVQLALLLLLASVFFSGLALDLSQFSAPVRAGSELLPVTQASRLLQELLLRGGPADTARVAALGAMTVVLFLVGWLAVRRTLAHPA